VTQPKKVKCWLLYDYADPRTSESGKAGDELSLNAAEVEHLVAQGLVTRTKPRKGSGKSG
jgi:hypothetical protein